MRVSNAGEWPLLATSLFLFLCATASAQEEGLQRGSQIVTGFTGPFYGLGGESEGSDAEDGDGLELESDWGFGGSYRYFFTRNLSLEASATIGRGEGEIEGAGTDDPEDSENEGNGNGEDAGGEEGTSGDALFVTGSLVYHFRPEGRLVPYVSAGAGLLRISVGGSDTSRPAGVFGGGLLVGLTKSVMIRVDARDHLYTLDQGGSSSTFNDLSLTGGGSLRF